MEGMAWAWAWAWAWALAWALALALAFAKEVFSSLLGDAIDNLVSTLVKEFGNLLNVEEEEGELETKLQMIRSVIRSAYERQQKDADGRFLGKLKDYAYDVEDLVEDFRAEALRQKFETQDGMLKKVHNFFSTSNPLVCRFNMARNIQVLKKRLDDIVKEKKDFNLADLLGVHNPLPPASKSRETDSYVIEEDVCGRDVDKAKIIDALINSGYVKNVSVIPIVAIGGMGKTTLAQLVYNDKKSVETHFDLRMWIYVSQNFDVKRILKVILQSVNHNASDQLSMEQLQTKVGEALGDKKYLLVLDDVWNEDREAWLELERRLRCGAVGSKILVTTRSDTVASIVGTLQTYHLEKLSESDGLSLFKKLAFGDKQEQPNLVSIGEEIVKKCGGVPLAIKTLGSLMYSKESEREWELVRDNDIWKLQGEDNRILAALRLSYDHLTPSLKECFAYCIVYPKGWAMDLDELIKQWIAHGFIQCSEGNELLEEKGVEYFKTLCSRSFFQYGHKDISVNGYGGSRCRMHDLFHDLAIAVAGNEFAFSGRHNRTVARHLSVKEVELKYMKAFENFDKMRSIIVFFYSNDVVSEVNVCLRFRRLRVLDLSGSWINYLPKSIGKCKHLRFLDLSWTDIEELPDTICNLFNLQTLKLCGSKIQKLPKGIRRMISLRHIELLGTRSHVLMPNGIGELASLRTLPEFIVGENSGCGIEVLKNLNLLKGHVSIKSLGNIKDPQCAREASLKEKKYLHSMELSFDRFDRDVDDTQEGIQESVIQYLEPHSRLKMIDIADYMGRKFPTWMEQINLVKLSLSNCPKCQHLPQLGCLPSLESLSLRDMSAIEYIVEFDNCYDKKSIFPSLKQLYIRNLPNLKGCSIVGADVVGPSEPDDQLFPRLCSLSVDNCLHLTSFPKGLTALEVLSMRGVGCSKLDISSSQSTLKKLNLSKMPNLEGLSSQQATSNDGQAKEVGACLSIPSLSTLEISECPKLTHLPSLILPALQDFKMSLMCLNKIQFTSNYPLMESFYITDMPDLESWSSQVDDDDDERKENKTGRSDDGRLSIVIKDCPKMIDIPWLPPSLDKLCVVKSNEKLLRSVAHYTSLSSLKIEGFSEMTSLPLQVLVSKHTKLHELIIRDCPKLMFLSDWLENLPALNTLMIEKCPDLELMLHQHWLSSLQDLTIIGNSCKKQIVFPSGDTIVFHCLRKLHIEGLRNLESFCEGLRQNLIVFHSLRELEIRGFDNIRLKKCPKLEDLPEWLGNLSLLEKLSINSCPCVGDFPESVKNLTSLKTLKIKNCENLEHLFEDLNENKGDHFTNLEELSIEDCPKLPESVKNLTSLKTLKIKNCDNLQHLFEDLNENKEDHFTNLEELSIEGCPKLEDLPKWLGNLSLLEKLSIDRCPRVRVLPKSFRNLTSLKRLAIRYCPSMNALPPEIQKHLKQNGQLQIYECPLLERRIQSNDGEEAAHVAWILPKRLMELLKKTPCINSSSSSFS